MLSLRRTGLRRSALLGKRAALLARRRAHRASRLVSSMRPAPRAARRRGDHRSAGARAALVRTVRVHFDSDGSEAEVLAERVRVDPTGVGRRSRTSPSCTTRTAGLPLVGLVECAKKLLLTGLPSFVFDDPVAQVAAAQLVSLGAVLLLHVHAPYADASDSRFALLSGWNTVLIILAGQIMGLNERQSEAEREQYTWLLIALVVLVLGGGLMLIAREFGACAGAARRGLEEGNKAGAAASAGGREGRGRRRRVPGGGRGGRVADATPYPGGRGGRVADAPYPAAAEEEGSPTPPRTRRRPRRRGRRRTPYPPTSAPDPLTLTGRMRRGWGEEQKEKREKKEKRSSRRAGRLVDDRMQMSLRG